MHIREEMEYTITKYKCTDASQAAEIGALANAANVQQARNSGFHTNVQPWHLRCKDAASIHWIARSSDGTIIGWLVAIFSEREGQKYGFIYEIARNRRVPAAGLGLQLHNAFIAEAIERGADFTFLYPLNDTVANLYKRPEWGYVQVHPSITQLFRILRAPPSEEFLQEYYPPTVKQLVDLVYEIKDSAPKNTYLGRLVIAAQRFLAADPESIASFMEFAEMTYGSRNNDHESFLEFRNSLQDKLRAYILEKGGVLPREVKHTYKNSRGGRRRGLRMRRTVRGRW